MPGGERQQQKQWPSYYAWLCALTPDNRQALTEAVWDYLAGPAARVLHAYLEGWVGGWVGGRASAGLARGQAGRHAVQGQAGRGGRQA